MLVMQGLFSNAMVSKMVQKRMQGKAGLGTKMVLPRKRMQVSPLWFASSATVAMGTCCHMSSHRGVSSPQQASRHLEAFHRICLRIAVSCLLCTTVHSSLHDSFVEAWPKGLNNYALQAAVADNVITFVHAAAGMQNKLHHDIATGTSTDASYDAACSIPSEQHEPMQKTDLWLCS